MAITQLRNAQIKDATLTRGKLVADFVDGATWNLSSTNTAVLTGLADPTNNNDAATKQYIDNIIDSNLKSPDGYDTNGAGDYPTDYKSTGAVSEGDMFYITSVANGTAVGSKNVNVGDSLIALVDAPGNTDANWVIMESNRDQATETVKGVAEIATTAEITAGTDDNTIVTPLKLAGAISDASTTAGAGLTDTSGTYDVVAADASLKINADDMAVQEGTTNGTSLETTATGVELAATVTGTRTFSQAAGESFTISNTDVNAVTLGAQPDGAVALAVATTKYVDDQIASVQDVFGELPSVTDGSADVTLTNTPLANTERVYLNGQRMVAGSGNDYTISGTTITFASNLQTGDVVIVDYKY